LELFEKLKGDFLVHSVLKLTCITTVACTFQRDGEGSDMLEKYF